MDKKADAKTFFLLIISAVTIVIILILGYTTFQKINQNALETRLNKFSAELYADFDSLSVTKGIKKSLTYNIPNTEKLCFLDYTQRTMLIKSPELMEYPVVHDLVSTPGTGENVIVFLNNGKQLFYEIKNVSINSYPHFFCFESDTEEFTFKVESGKVPRIDISPTSLTLIDYDANDKTKREYVIYSHDKHLKLTIPIGTKIKGDSSKNVEIIRISKSYSFNDGIEKYTITGQEDDVDDPNTNKLNFDPGTNVKLEYTFYESQDCTHIETLNPVNFRENLPAGLPWGTQICDSEKISFTGINQLEYIPPPGP